jgi:glutathione S-transferase
MIKLYDFELSGSCYKIRLLMNILNVKYDKVNVDFVNKEHRSDKYLKLNPFGSIPIFEDDGVLLRDSAGMLVYLAKKYDQKKTWYPDDPETQGHIQK